MALDYEDAIERLVVLDIVPTYKLYHSVIKEFAKLIFTGFFLIQPAPFPETLIGDNVEFFLKNWVFNGAYPAASMSEILRNT